MMIESLEIGGSWKLDRHASYHCNRCGSRMTTMTEIHYYEHELDRANKTMTVDHVCSNCVERLRTQRDAAQSVVGDVNGQP